MILRAGVGPGQFHQDVQLDLSSPRQLGVLVTFQASADNSAGGGWRA